MSKVFENKLAEIIAVVEESVDKDKKKKTKTTYGMLHKTVDAKKDDEDEDEGGSEGEGGGDGGVSAEDEKTDDKKKSKKDDVKTESKPDDTDDDEDYDEDDDDFEEDDDLEFEDGEDFWNEYVTEEELNAMQLDESVRRIRVIRKGKPTWKLKSSDPKRYKISKGKEVPYRPDEKKKRIKAMLLIGKKLSTRKKRSKSVKQALKKIIHR
jgi:hypothetical protein